MVRQDVADRGHVDAMYSAEYQPVTILGGIFENPFLRVGTPHARSHGQHVRLFLIFETPDPRLLEKPTFQCESGADIDMRACGGMNEMPAPRAPKPTAHTAHVTQHTPKHCVASLGRLR